jgi:hypothetical protein
MNTFSEIKNRSLLNPGFLYGRASARLDLDPTLESIGYAKVDTLHPVACLFELQTWVIG